MNTPILNSKRPANLDARWQIEAGRLFLDESAVKPQPTRVGRADAATMAEALVKQADAYRGGEISRSELYSALKQAFEQMQAVPAAPGHDQSEPTATHRPSDSAKPPALGLFSAVACAMLANAAGVPLLAAEPTKLRHA